MQDNHGKTPLELAGDNGHMKIIDLLTSNALLFLTNPPHPSTIKLERND
jgi:ankyrin repeat protein